MAELDALLPLLPAVSDLYLELLDVTDVAAAVRLQPCVQVPLYPPLACFCPRGPFNMGWQVVRL